MPRDGSGNYTQPVSSVSPAVFNTTISDVDFNALMTDVSTEMTDSVDRSGKGALLANMACGGFKLTNVGAPTVTGDAVRLDTSNGTVPGLTGGAFAAAGKIGEQFTTNNTVTATSGTDITICSIAPTAGIWLIFGSFLTFPAGTTTTTAVHTSISTTNNSITPVVNNARQDQFFPTVLPAATQFGGFTGTAAVSISSTTTYYLVVQTTFAVSTMQVAGRITGMRIG